MLRSLEVEAIQQATIMSQRGTPATRREYAKSPFFILELHSDCPPDQNNMLMFHMFALGNISWYEECDREKQDVPKRNPKKQIKPTFIVIIRVRDVHSSLADFHPLWKTKYLQ